MSLKVQSRSTFCLCQFLLHICFLQPFDHSAAKAHVCALLVTSAFPCKKLCVSVAKLEHSAALKEEKQFDRTDISSLQGVSDSFGLEGSKCLGLHKDSWLLNHTSERYAKP